MPTLLIEHETRYRAYIQEQGVGDKDLVASSPDSYVSYLRSVSRLLGAPISPELLHCENNVEEIANRLKGNRARTPSTITSLRCGSTSLWFAMTAFSHSLRAELLTEKDRERGTQLAASPLFSYLFGLSQWLERGRTTLMRRSGANKKPRCLRGWSPIGNRRQPVTTFGFENEKPSRSLASLHFSKSPTG